MQEKARFSIRCFLGVHKWSKWEGPDNNASHDIKARFKEKYCKRCNKYKRVDVGYY